MHQPSATTLPAQAPSAFAFGGFVLIPERHQLLLDGAPVKIGRRALDLLTALVERQGAVVSKHFLMSHAWPSVVVEEGNLKVNIAALRRALGDGTDHPRYIATVAGRGYRFVSPVRRADAAAASLRPDPAPKPSGNLPKSAKRVFGRASTIAAVLRDLESSSLVSIVGPGGMGKTTVAVAVAREAAHTFADGAWFVDLAEVDDEARVPDAVAKALGLKARSGLSAHLRGRKLLLVLDNCEHVIDGVAGFAHQLLTQASDVTLLATSREPLCIQGERVRRLSGLSTPPASSSLRARAALEFAAIQLFVEHASQTSRTFALDDDDDAAIVAEICRRVDGLALAIERLAMRAGELDVGQLLEQLESSRYMLDDGRAGPERHRTLTTALEWSYRLLSGREQTVLRRLATFVADFTLESACAVGAGDGAPAFGVVEDVAALAAKSLLAVELHEGKMSYRQSKVTRAFALEKLIASGELGDARRRHAAHFLELAEQAGAEHDRLPSAEWLARRGALLGDLQSALEWAFDEPAGAAVAVRLAAALVPFWKAHGLTEACRTASERALEDRYREHRSARDEQILRAACEHPVASNLGPDRR